VVSVDKAYVSPLILCCRYRAASDIWLLLVCEAERFQRPFGVHVIYNSRRK